MVLLNIENLSNITESAQKKKSWSVKIEVLDIQCLTIKQYALVSCRLNDMRIIISNLLRGISSDFRAINVLLENSIFNFFLYIII